jgi:ribonuclease P/MRP protein subunit RPP1
MNRCFADLHLRVNPAEPQVTQHFIERAAKLGYSQISIPFTTQLDDTQISGLKAACTVAGLDFVVRADFKPRNQEDLMRFLRKFRRKAEVICIICDDKEIARSAAKDHRVDLINFPSLDYHKRFFDRAEAELAVSNQTALEVDVKSLLVLEGPPRVRLLSSVRREVALAKEFHVPLVLSSGVSEAQYMRMPRDMASIAYLFGLTEVEALDAVSTNPNRIVSLNRMKLGPKFVAPGITILQEGKAD